MHFLRETLYTLAASFEVRCTEAQKGTRGTKGVGGNVPFASVPTFVFFALFRGQVCIGAQLPRENTKVANGWCCSKGEQKGSFWIFPFLISSLILFYREGG